MFVSLSHRYNCFETKEKGSYPRAGLRVMILYRVYPMRSWVRESCRRFFPSIALFISLVGWTLIAGAISGQIKDSTKSPPAKSFGQISGHVYRGNSSEAISKAMVELTATHQETYDAAGGPRIVRTDADGAFTFTDLPPGDYQITVSHNGYAQFTWVRSERNSTLNRPLSEDNLISLQPEQRIDGIVLRLHPAGIIAGQITDEDHDPVPRLEVMALAVDYVHGGHKKINLAGKAVTDDLGNFRVANLSPGPYYVKAGGLVVGEMKAVALKQGPAGSMQYRDTYYPGTPSLDEAQPLQVSGDGTSEAEFTVPFQRTYSISGKVLQSPGEPHAGFIEWRAQAAEGYLFSMNSDTTDLRRDGSFKISQLPPGEYTLTASAMQSGRENDLGYALAHIVDSDVRANIEIGRAAEIHGKVEAPPGLSVAGKEIALQTFGPGFYLLHPGTIGSTGQFDIKNAPPGEFTFTLLGRGKDESVYIKKAICGGRDYSSSAFTLDVSAALDCNMTLANDAGVVRGKIMDGDNPAAKMVAVLIPQSRELRQNPRYTLTSKTDASGGYSIAGVIPGDYLLFAVPPSRNHEYFAVDFAEQHGGGEQVSLKPSATQIVDLKGSNLQ